MKNTILLIALAISASAFATHAPAAHAPKQTDDTAVFEKLKTLGGFWKGTAVVAGSSMPTSVYFQVTSGGHAVEEVIAPHTDHEMVTIYYLDHKSLVLTHYCEMGNQPQMKLTANATPTNFGFDFTGGANIGPKDGHMHSTTLKLISPTTMETTWTAKGGDKTIFVVKMNLKKA